MHSVSQHKKMTLYEIKKSQSKQKAGNTFSYNIWLDCENHTDSSWYQELTMIKNASDFTETTGVFGYNNIYQQGKNRKKEFIQLPSPCFWGFCFVFLKTVKAENKCSRLLVKYWMYFSAECCWFSFEVQFWREISVIFQKSGRMQLRLRHFGMSVCSFFFKLRKTSACQNFP